MSTVVRFGRAILGEWRSGATSRKPAMLASERQARQRRNSLSRLVKYRVENGLALGSAAAWAHVLGNTLAALRQEVTTDAVAALAARLGLPPIDAETISGATADIESTRRVWHGYRLRTAGQVGSMLELTSVEREECRITDISAVDESPGDRRRRLDRERKKADRAARAAQAGPRLTQVEMAKLEGISLSTWQRRNRDLKSVGPSSRKKDGWVRDTRARVKKPTRNRSPDGGGNA